MLKNQTLIIPALLWIIGLLTARVTNIPIITLILIISLLLVFFLFKKLRIFSLFLIIIFLGIFRYDIQRKFTHNHIRTILASQPTLTQPIQGRIISEVKYKEGNFNFVLELNKIKDVEITGKIKFYTSTDSLTYGDMISTVATIKQIHGSTNPGAFDYKEFLEAKKIFCSGWAISPVKRLANKTDPFKQIVINCRKYLRNRIKKRFGENAGFVKAIVIAEKDEIDDKRLQMSRAGLSHLLAVSGLHVGLLSLILLSILNVFITKRNISRIIIMILLLVYAAICLWAPSVTRAAVMIILYCTAKILQRKPIANNIIFASLIIITAINPNQLFSVGFQMSYLAVFVLVNILPKIRFIRTTKDDIEILSKSKKLLNGMIILIFTSLILNLFLSPITAYYFHQFGFNGIAGNFLGIPLIGIILPLSLIIIFLPASIIPLFQNSFKLLMIIFNGWTKLSADLPLHFDFIFISLLHFILIYLIFFIIIQAIKYSNKYRKFYLTSALIPIIIFFLIGKQSSRKLTITFFDCDLGDLALIQTPNKKTMFIDTGPPKKVMNSFSRSALPYLQQNGIKTIDHVLITHAHNDHYGGLTSLLENLKVDNIITTDDFQQRNVWNKFSTYIEAEQCSVLTISDTISINLDNVDLKIIHPDRSYTDSNINNNSIVFRLDYEEISVLFTGDLEREGEEHLITKYPEFLDCDIIKVGHHGSKTASSLRFIQAVEPQYAIISTAKQNRFNFPHKITLERFAFIGRNLMITGYDGACQIVSDGKSAQITTFVSHKNIIDNELK